MGAVLIKLYEQTIMEVLCFLAELEFGKPTPMVATRFLCRLPGLRFAEMLSRKCKSRDFARR